MPTQVKKISAQTAELNTLKCLAEVTDDNGDQQIRCALCSFTVRSPGMLKVHKEAKSKMHKRVKSSIMCISAKFSNGHFQRYIFGKMTLLGNRCINLWPEKCIISQIGNVF